MNVWLLLIGMGLVTYAIRLSLIVLIGRVDVPPIIQRALRFVPPAVLSAIIFPELLRPGGTLDLSFGNVRLLAGVLAALVAWRTKNVLADDCSWHGGAVGLAGSGSLKYHRDASATFIASSRVPNWNEIQRLLIGRQCQHLLDLIVIECPDGYCAQIQRRRL